MPPTVRILLRCPADEREPHASLVSIRGATRSHPFEVTTFDGSSVRGPELGEAILTSEATYCVLLDGACRIPRTDWLDRLVETFERFPAAALVQPEVVRRDGDDESGGGLPTYASVWAWPYETPAEVAEVTGTPASSQPYEAMAGTGSCAFVRTDTFVRLGGFDREITGLSASVMDYCLRGWLLGSPTIVDPRIQIHSLRRDDSEAGSEDTIHDVLKTTYKVLSPRRRDVAEASFKKHGLHAEVERAIARIEAGPWLRERAAHERARVHDDDWLFDKFLIHEERYGKRE